MIVSLDTTSTRKFPAWLVRVRLNSRWYQVSNLLSPRFWADWWVMWRGRRVWALGWHVRNMMVAIPEPPKERARDA